MVWLHANYLSYVGSNCNVFVSFFFSYSVQKVIRGPVKIKIPCFIVPSVSKLIIVEIRWLDIKITNVVWSCLNSSVLFVINLSKEAIIVSRIWKWCILWKYQILTVFELNFKFLMWYFLVNFLKYYLCCCEIYTHKYLLFYVELRIMYFIIYAKVCTYFIAFVEYLNYIIFLNLVFWRFQIEFSSLLNFGIEWSL